MNRGNRSFGRGGNLEGRIGVRGTLMRHAGTQGSETSPVGPLPVAMVQPAFRAGLMAGAGGTQGSPAGRLPTSHAAVHLAAVTPSAQIEDHTAKSAPDFTIAVVHHPPDANASSSLTTGEPGGRLRSKVGVRKMSTRGPGSSTPRSPTFLAFANGEVLIEIGRLGETHYADRKGQKDAGIKGRSQGRNQVALSSWTNTVDALPLRHWVS